MVARIVGPDQKQIGFGTRHQYSLWEDVDDPGALDRVTVKEGIDDVVYHPGAIVWRVDRKVLTRSGMMRLTSEDLYKQMTIRNVNTVRKLADMMTDG